MTFGLDPEWDFPISRFQSSPRTPEKWQLRPQESQQSSWGSCVGGMLQEEGEMYQNHSSIALMEVYSTSTRTSFDPSHSPEWERNCSDTNAYKIHCFARHLFKVIITLVEVQGTLNLE